MKYFVTDAAVLLITVLLFSEQLPKKISKRASGL